MTNILKIKRIEQEVKTFDKEREFYYQVIQDVNDIHTFYYILRGNDNSDYSGGYYLGKIVLPPDYPTENPAFYMLTPSGRFDIDHKICLTNSNYHSENNYKSSSWSITKMIVGMASIFENDETSGIAHLRKTPQERKDLAEKSIAYNFEKYNDIFQKFDNYFKIDGTMRTNEQEIKDYVAELHKIRKERLELKRNKKNMKLMAKRNQINNCDDNMIKIKVNNNNNDHEKEKVNNNKDEKDEKEKETKNNKKVNNNDHEKDEKDEKEKETKKNKKVNDNKKDENDKKNKKVNDNKKDEKDEKDEKKKETKKNKKVNDKKNKKVNDDNDDNDDNNDNKTAKLKNKSKTRTKKIE